MSAVSPSTPLLNPAGEGQRLDDPQGILGDRKVTTLPELDQDITLKIGGRVAYGLGLFCTAVGVCFAAGLIKNPESMGITLGFMGFISIALIYKTIKNESSISLTEREIEKINASPVLLREQISQLNADLNVAQYNRQVLIANNPDLEDPENYRARRADEIVSELQGYIRAAERNLENLEAPEPAQVEGAERLEEGAVINPRIDPELDGGREAVEFAAGGLCCLFRPFF